jgi:hypothetical protein
MNKMNVHYYTNTILIGIKHQIFLNTIYCFKIYFTVFKILGWQGTIFIEHIQYFV